MTQRRIQVLPDNLANKIAAGEVIQRPESVVKELLENSLDAGAKYITIVVEDGGKKLIQITDDGVGMDEQDAATSFLRHATSKIASYEDLEAIATYGFRGEALASVAAVAQVTMKTRRREDDAATVLQVNGGGNERASKEGREPGTTIIVQNLFYNVPARRKFLKSSNTEFRHIYETVQRTALSHPELAFEFISDGEIILSLKPSTLQERLVDVFGDRVAESIVGLEERSEYLSVSGFIGKPQFGQKTRLNQFLYLNKRFISNRNINHAVFSAYENLLIKGAFPFFILFLDIDPHRFDVNVHPSKMEAKFEDEQAIYRFISTLVRRTLSTNNLIPAVSAGVDQEDGVGLRFTDRQHSWPNTQGGGFPTGADFGRSQPDFAFQRSPADGATIAAQLLGTSQQMESRFAGAQAEPTTSTVPSSALVWQIHNKYILAQIENGLMVIDQHVAHERVLYERALARFENNLPMTQQLLFPRTITLTPGDYALAEELLPHFMQLGFSLKPFGKNTMVIDGVPPDLKSGSEGKIIQDLLDLYREYQERGQMDSRDTLAKSYSCKAAIKAGDKMSETEMRSLIDQLFVTKIPYVCPHGRPVVLKISIDELDRRFGRT